MKAHEIMTRTVVSVAPEANVRDVAKLLTERGISGVPVLSPTGTLVGIISQSDLLHRAELGTERRRKGWLAFFADPDTMARDFAKSHARHAADLMTRRVVSVRPDTDLSEVAGIMDAHQIKRVMVVDNGALVGLVTRGDLVRALCRADAPRPAESLPPGALHKRVVDKMKSLPWLDATFVSFTLDDGVVELWGLVRSADQRDALRVALEEVDGVREVRSELRVEQLQSYGI